MFHRAIMRQCTPLLLAGLFASACSGDVVALVGKQAISRSELEATATILALQRDPVLLSSREQQAALKREVLNALIDQYLVTNAATAAHIHLTDQELTEYLDAHKGRYSDDSFRDMLTQKGIDADTWRTQRERQLITERYMATVIEPTITVTDAAIAQYYKDHANEFHSNEAIRMRQILVADRNTATTVRKRVLNGENFAQLAVEYSIAPEAERGGDLGWIEHGQYPAVFEETGFRLPVGAMSDVVQSPYGYHLFKVLERRHGAPRALPEVKHEIAAQLRQAAITQAFATQLTTLRNTATIVIRHEALQRALVSRAAQQ